MAEPTIANGFAEAFLHFAVARGADRQTLIEQSRLRPEDLTERDNRLPLATYLALMKAGIKLCDEPALALLFGAGVSLSDISILGSVGHAATAAEGLCQANRYARLAIDGGDGETAHRLELVPEDGKVWLKFTSTLSSPTTRCSRNPLSRAACVTDGSWPRPRAVLPSAPHPKKFASHMQSRATAQNTIESLASRWCSAAA